MKPSKPKKKLLQSNQLLIQAIINEWNGIRPLARQINVLPQTLVHWRRAGKVPLSMTNQISKALGVSIWALNYRELKELLNGVIQIPTWEEVVKKCKLRKDIEESILKIKDIK